MQLVPIMLCFERLYHDKMMNSANQTCMYWRGSTNMRGWNRAAIGPPVMLKHYVTMLVHPLFSLPTCWCWLNNVPRLASTWLAHDLHIAPSEEEGRKERPNKQSDKAKLFTRWMLTWTEKFVHEGRSCFIFQFFSLKKIYISCFIIFFKRLGQWSAQNPLPSSEISSDFQIGTLFFPFIQTGLPDNMRYSVKYLKQIFI